MTSTLTNLLAALAAPSSSSGSRTQSKLGTQGEDFEAHLWPDPTATPSPSDEPELSPRASQGMDVWPRAASPLSPPQDGQATTSSAPAGPEGPDPLGPVPLGQQSRGAEWATPELPMQARSEAGRGHAPLTRPQARQLVPSAAAQILFDELPDAVAEAIDNAVPQSFSQDAALLHADGSRWRGLLGSSTERPLPTEPASSSHEAVASLPAAVAQALPVPVTEAIRAAVRDAWPRELPVDGPERVTAPDAVDRLPEETDAVLEGVARGLVDVVPVSLAQVLPQVLAPTAESAADARSTARDLSTRDLPATLALAVATVVAVRLPAVLADAVPPGEVPRVPVERVRQAVVQALAPRMDQDLTTVLSTVGRPTPETPRSAGDGVPSPEAPSLRPELDAPEQRLPPISQSARPEVAADRLEGPQPRPVVPRDHRVTESPDTPTQRPAPTPSSTPSSERHASTLADRGTPPTQAPSAPVEVEASAQPSAQPSAPRRPTSPEPAVGLRPVPGSQAPLDAQPSPQRAPVSDGVSVPLESVGQPADPKGPLEAPSPSEPRGPTTPFVEAAPSSRADRSAPVPEQVALRAPGEASQPGVPERPATSAERAVPPVVRAASGADRAVSVDRPAAPVDRPAAPVDRPAAPVDRSATPVVDRGASMGSVVERAASPERVVPVAERAASVDPMPSMVDRAAPSVEPAVVEAAPLKVDRSSPLVPDRVSPLGTDRGASVVEGVAPVVDRAALVVEGSAPADRGVPLAERVSAMVERAAPVERAVAPPERVAPPAMQRASVPLATTLGLDGPQTAVASEVSSDRPLSARAVAPSVARTSVEVPSKPSTATASAVPRGVEAAVASEPVSTEAAAPRRGLVAPAGFAEVDAPTSPVDELPSPRARTVARAMVRALQQVLPDTVRASLPAVGTQLDTPEPSVASLGTVRPMPVEWTVPQPLRQVPRAPASEAASPQLPRAVARALTTVLPEVVTRALAEAPAPGEGTTAGVREPQVRSAVLGALREALPATSASAELPTGVLGAATRAAVAEVTAEVVARVMPDAMAEVARTHPDAEPTVVVERTTQLLSRTVPEAIRQALPAVVADADGPLSDPAPVQPQRDRAGASQRSVDVRAPVSPRVAPSFASPDGVTASVRTTVIGGFDVPSADLPVAEEAAVRQPSELGRALVRESSPVVAPPAPQRPEWVQPEVPLHGKAQVSTQAGEEASQSVVERGREAPVLSERSVTVAPPRGVQVALSELLAKPSRPGRSLDARGDAELGPRAQPSRAGAPLSDRSQARSQSVPGASVSVPGASASVPVASASVPVAVDVPTPQAHAEPALAQAETPPPLPTQPEAYDMAEPAAPKGAQDLVRVQVDADLAVEMRTVRQGHQVTFDGTAEALEPLRGAAADLDDALRRGGSELAGFEQRRRRQDRPDSSERRTVEQARPEPVDGPVVTGSRGASNTINVVI
ncbi:MAG: hypothetical protein KTR31_23330 [Myxococcales bacterium]|nr:hypothetical protein [Myxococcales bacterium]